MPRHKDYPDHTTHRKRSVLPPELQTDLVEMSTAMRTDTDVSTHLSSCVSEMKRLPPDIIIRATTEIRDAGNLYTRSKSGERLWLAIPLALYTALSNAEQAALAKFPQLAYVYIFHADGRLREAALKRLDEPPDSPFIFAAIVARLNDWVEEVRNAACDCADRLFPRVSPGTVAETSFFLFAQMQHWGRWGVRERHVLETTLYRPDVLQVFADLLIARRSGKVATVLRNALSQPGLDHTLPMLAREAASPTVRAIAYETLIFRGAQWRVGYQYQWVDKRYGVRRRVPRFRLRPLDHQLDIENLITGAARDRAVAVRKVAARGLVDLRHDLSSRMVDVGQLLARDIAASIRSRAQFYLDKISDS